MKINIKCFCQINEKRKIIIIKSIKSKVDLINQDAMGFKPINIKLIINTLDIGIFAFFL